MSKGKKKRAKASSAGSAAATIEAPAPQSAAVKTGMVSLISAEQSSLQYGSDHLKAAVSAVIITFSFTITSTYQ